MKGSFHEPSPGFKALLSKWQGNDDKFAKENSHNVLSISKSAAKKEYLRKSQLVDKVSANKALRQVKNVYQQPLSVDVSFQPPVYSKTDSEQKLIEEALSKNFVFDDLTHRDLVPLVAAFEKVRLQAKETVIHQGDPGDYFYIIQSGQVAFQIHGEQVGQAGKGASFGELALLYTCPRAATVATLQDTTLFRVDQVTFRFILQSQTQKNEQEKLQLLLGVNFLQDLTQADLTKLSSVMTPRVFQKDEVLVKKGDPGDAFYIIQEGQCMVKDISVGATEYADQKLGPGEYFGERSLVTDEPRAANVVGLTKGIAFSIDRQTFERVLGSMSQLILKAQDCRKLAGVPIFQKAKLDGAQLAGLSDLIEDQFHPKGSTLLKRAKESAAALYFVREGKVHLESGKRNEDVQAGGYFGADTLLKACETCSDSLPVPYSATCMMDCMLGVLTLADCRMVFDTKVLFEQDQTDSDDEEFSGEDVPICSASLEELTKHKILGEGTFGQCWLVTEAMPDQSRRPYALKIQSKHDLVMEGQDKAVIQEKNIMMKMHHPCIINLVKTFQDDHFVYMLLEFLQGGELFSVIHDVHKIEVGLEESQAKFYALGVADALAHMHRSKIVYRDLKPENVMIDATGYPVLIDFGFAKYVADKTYTLCGTPGFLPPEVVMTRGHNCSADHWSFGILVYEMITGESPFYFEGMDQMSLFRSIVQDDYEVPESMSEEATDLVSRLLVKDPTRRLGSLIRGEREIFEQAWFKSLDRLSYRRRLIEAPWIPDIKDPLDTGCFDDWDHLEDKTKQRQPTLNPAKTKVFEEF